MIYIVELGVGFKCPRKIYLNTQWGGRGGDSSHSVPTALLDPMYVVPWTPLTVSGTKSSAFAQNSMQYGMLAMYSNFKSS